MSQTKTSRTKVQLDGFGEPLNLQNNAAWVQRWQFENAARSTEEALVYGLIVTPQGGNEYRPGPKFVSPESLMERRLFVRKESCKKPTYVELNKQESLVDYARGVVKLPWVLSEHQFGAFLQRKPKDEPAAQPVPDGWTQTELVPEDVIEPQPQTETQTQPEPEIVPVPVAETLPVAQPLPIAQPLPVAEIVTDDQIVEARAEEAFAEAKAAGMSDEHASEVAEFMAGEEGPTESKPKKRSRKSKK